MNSTGDKLRALRNKYNMTAQELADKLGVTAPAISLWEHNKREIDNSTLLKIATIFNVTQFFLLGDRVFKPTLSERDEKDIQKRLELLMNDLDSETGLAFYNGDGEMDDETRELLRASLDSALRITKLKAKEKFTPNKYRE